MGDSLNPILMQNGPFDGMLQILDEYGQGLKGAVSRCFGGQGDPFVMIETDCPYMSPEPARHIKPNEPALMMHTARFIAELKGVPLEELASSTTEMAKRFFNLA
jgi:hypothetical protein